MKYFAKCLLGILLLPIVALGVTVGMTSFNAGEFSPLLEFRSDFSKYDNACSELENMYVLIQGPVVRRPGSKYIAEVKDSDDVTRLLRFEYAKTDAYVLEFGDLYMRVYRNGAQVESAGSPYEIVTPFSTEELPSIQFVQSADVVYLVDGNDPPQKLSRTGHTSWTIEDMNFAGTGPFRDENTSTTTLTPSATTGAITLEASAAIFDADHVGSIWQIRHLVDANSLTGILDANESSATITVEGSWHFTTHGSWTGLVTLQRSDDDGSNWAAALPPTYSKYDTNIDEIDEETEPGIIYRVNMADFVSGSCTYNLALSNYYQTGSVEITDFNTTTDVNATVIIELGGTDATDKWSEGYWSDHRGWPQTVEFHEQRLGFAGSETYPQTIWMSQTDDYNNMTIGTEDDDGLIYVLPGQNPIQWMLSSEFLFIGSIGGAGRLGGSDPDQALTPTNVEYKSQTRNGSALIQAVQAGGAILFVERSGMKVREFAYSLEQDKFVAPDLTILAEHITGDGVIEIAYQSRPYPLLWCVLDDGDIAVMGYNRENDVIGWSRVTTDGDYESVSVIPSTGEDQVWAIVNRTIDSSTVRYVEQFQPIDWGTDQNDCFFVDSGGTFDGGAAVTVSGVTQAAPAVVTVSAMPTALANGDLVKFYGVGGMTDLNWKVYGVNEVNSVDLTFELRDPGDTIDINSVGFTAFTSGGRVQEVARTITGLDHLEGETISILGDGSQMSDETVASGSITIDNYAGVIHYGLPYTSELETMPLLFQEEGQGVSASRTTRISAVRVNFYKSLGVQVGTISGTEAVSFVDPSDDVSARVSLFSGWRQTPVLQGFWDIPTVYLKQEEPLPMTVKAIVSEL